MKLVTRLRTLSTAFMITLVCLSNHLNAVELHDLGCTTGDLVNRGFTTTKNQSKMFSYSKSCQASSKRYRERDAKNDHLITVELQIPSQNFEKQPVTKKKTAKAFLTLSYGPTPAMIHAEADALRRKSDYLREKNGYSLYTRNLGNDPHKYFFPKNKNNFYAVCTEDYCYIKGIEENNETLYDLHILDPEYRNWDYLHRLIIDFIRKIALKG